MTTNPSLLLAIDLDGDGAHPAAWRHAARPPGDVLTAAAVRSAVVAAEAAGYAFATFEDGPRAPSPDGLEAGGRVEAGTRAAFVATTTTEIGLAPRLFATTTEPFHVATQLASLDHASRGRGAWLVGGSADPADLATIGALPLTPEAARREVRDAVDVARRLWDSWQDDAVIEDVATGRYLDADRVHHVDFAGASFTVKGPLITPRPPQGQVVVVAPAELDIDDLADVVLVGSLEARADPDAIRARADRARDAGAPLVFVDVETVLAETDAAARQRLDELDGATPWPTGRLRHVGTPAGLLELLASLAGVVDGVRLLPAVHRVDGNILTAEVLPVVGTRARGATLRDTLGLPRPVNRYAA